MIKKKKHWYTKYREFMTPKLLVVLLFSIPIIIIYVKFFAEPEIKELPIIEEGYVYFKKDTTATRAVAVHEKDKIDRLKEYREIVYFEKTAADNGVYMDTATISISEKVGIIKYLNDSSVVLIRCRNKWFHEDIKETNINSKIAHIYVSVLDFHRQVPTR
jgi:hypothetical protein